LLLPFVLISTTQPTLPGDWVRSLVLCACGDVDGDEATDIAIGLPRDGSHGEEAGRVFIVSGRDGHTLKELSSGMRYSGFGFALDGGSDLDGDGKLDLAIGSHRDGFREAGGVIGHVWIAPLQRDAKFPFIAAHTAEGGFDEDFGHTVRIVGDVDADGLPDFIVESRDSSWVVDPTRPPVRLFSGKTGKLLRVMKAQPRGNPCLVGDIDGDHVRDVAFVDNASVTIVSMRDDGVLWTRRASELGFESHFVFDANDLDGDGRADIAVVGGGPAGSNCDSVLALSGRPGVRLWLAPGRLFDSKGIKPQVIWNERSFTVAATGDVDGDRVPDLIVGLGGMPESVGGAAILSGKTGSLIRLVRGNSDPEWTDYMLGESCVALGDVDGDGVADFAIGTAFSCTSEPYTMRPGIVRVHSGKTGALIFAWTPVPGGTPVVSGLDAKSKK
jgi:hypothetical protein